MDADGHRVPGEYVVGWAKRGPSGVIGTNKPDAVATVDLMLADVPETPPVPSDSADPDAITALLSSRGIRYVTFEAWKAVSALEEERGSALGRPRIKFIHVEDMLEQANC
jgi:ferredoxin--NADP+ reductase